jgi:SAM-dependent methyltransferase
LKSEWFETFFQGAAVEFWTRIVPPSLAIQEADFLVRTLGREPGSRFLDVPCGNGRHAIELARRGYRVTGVDLSDEFLAAARMASGGVDGLEWLKGDMRDLRQYLHPAGYSGVYCFGNSFGYLDYSGVQKFLGAVAEVLEPGSRLVIDTGLTAENIQAVLQTRRWHRTGDLVVLSEARYVAEASRLDIDYTFIDSGRMETRSSSSYLMTVAELTRLLAGAGFKVVSLAGGMGGEPFDLGPHGLILTAQLEG